MPEAGRPASPAAFVAGDRRNVGEETEGDTGDVTQDLLQAGFSIQTNQVDL